MIQINSTLSHFCTPALPTKGYERRSVGASHRKPLFCNCLYSINLL